jgi:hypothetical protein
MGKVNQPTDLNSVIRDHERRLNDLTKRVGLSSAVISRGGLRIIDGGELVMVDENDVVIFRIGKIDFGGISSGMRLGFDNGKPAFILGGSPGDQVWALFDEHENYIVTNDALSGYGLGRPYLGYRLVPDFAAQAVGEGNASMWPSTTNTTPTKLMRGINPVWHPRISIGVVTTTIGGGNVEWRLDINGNTVASGSGGGAQTVDVPGWGTDITPGDAIGFDLYANATGGATRAWIQVDRLYGTQS